DWITPMSAHSLTGYSHGNAGIALALLELYAVSQQAEFYTGAMYGFNYERQTYNPTVQNWPDFREFGAPQENGTHSCGEAWCHGAPGIAMTRLRAWKLTGDNSFKQEAEVALATTYKSVYQQLTHRKETANYSLCHGMAGNADILLSGAQDLNVPVYQQVVQQVGDFGIEQYVKTGLTWPSGVNDPTGLTKGMGETPGFMLGLAGTGYFYLRLAYPEQMKSMLIL
ncbi:MAG: lanthionine synthetase LanC family protein, partial [Bacteroidota bacterium]